MISKSLLGVTMSAKKEDVRSIVFEGKDLSFDSTLEFSRKSEH